MVEFKNKTFLYFIVSCDELQHSVAETILTCYIECIYWLEDKYFTINYDTNKEKHVAKNV